MRCSLSASVAFGVLLRFQAASPLGALPAPALQQVAKHQPPPMVVSRKTGVGTRQLEHLPLKDTLGLGFRVKVVDL